MARQNTSSRNLKSIVRAAIGLGLIILLGKLDGPAAQLTNLLGAAAREMLVLLPSFALAGWQALQTHAFGHQGFSACPVQILVSSWPLLQFLAGVA